MSSSCWQVLGIAPSLDTAAIRSAYQAQLSHTSSVTDYEGYKTLLAAYEEALRQARRAISAGIRFPTARETEVLEAASPVSSPAVTQPVSAVANESETILPEKAETVAEVVPQYDVIHADVNASVPSVLAEVLPANSTECPGQDRRQLSENDHWSVISEAVLTANSEDISELSFTDRSDCRFNTLRSAKEAFAIIEKEVSRYSVDEGFWLLLCSILLHSHQLNKKERTQVKEWASESIRGHFSEVFHEALQGEFAQGDTHTLYNVMADKRDEKYSRQYLWSIRPLFMNIVRPLSQPAKTDALIVLRAEMDNESNPLSLRMAINIWLGSYQMLVSTYQKEPTIPDWCIWEPNRRVGRLPTFIYITSFFMLEAFLSKYASTPLYWTLILLPALSGVFMCMRRLRDANKGWPTLLFFLIAFKWFPWVMFGVLFFKPDPLPNRYGPSRYFSTEQLDDLAHCLKQLS
ncbi:hypothetical protein QCD60_27020 [Pokkaliibacter sp. MBI-7]|uniref:DUF805 domain-containing protein n=1 Tax=Pokkaliibacter sp. MBI-7 TaxID=3040600 RepID=UPI0024488C4E|nr:DUF805 domain-containing protein [Pokkaliibacter sp. MBI-7]MDH2436189.1 hypothetical protein [Pokkaliibacter sp. MBI-7]